MDVKPLHADAGLGDVVDRVNQNTQAITDGLRTLQDVAASYASALPASVADRKALHELVDALRRDVGALGQAATDAASAASAAATKASAASSTAASLATRQPRAVSGMVPAITSVITTASADLTLTWPTAWPDNTYTVLAAVEPPAALLGKVSVAVKTKTPAAVTLTITASAVLASGSVPVRAASFP